MWIATTESQIKYVNLARAKGAIKLEKVGLKSRGGSVKSMMCKNFGISTRTPHDDVIKLIENKMKELLTTM